MLILRILKLNSFQYYLFDFIKKSENREIKLAIWLPCQIFNNFWFWNLTEKEMQVSRDVLEEGASYQGFMLKKENKYKNKILNGILKSKACRQI